MKIAVLDAKTLGLPASEWAELEKIAPCSFFDRTAPEELVRRAKDFPIVLTNKVRFPREIIERLPLLRYIGVLATGFDIVDCAAAKDHGIVVSNVPEYGTNSVAESVFALLLELCRRVGEHSRSVHEGEWTASPDFCYWKYPLTELSGKTFGVIGYGRIGKRVTEIARAFGMKTLVRRHSGLGAGEGDSLAESLHELLSKSDVVSLHVPLTPETESMICADTLRKMKKTAFLINTGRGKLVDEDALAFALKNGMIAGAALDVLREEPPKHSSPLIGLENCIITPHIAWAGEESRVRLLKIVTSNLESFLAGKTVNAVGGTGDLR